MIKKIILIIFVSLAGVLACNNIVFASDLSNVVIEQTGGDSKKDSKNYGIAIISTIIQYVSYVVGLASVIMIIYGGYTYTTSSGDTGKVGQAKKIILYSLIGLIVSVLASPIINWFLKIM